MVRRGVIKDAKRGDWINAVMSAVGYKLRLILR